MTDSSSPKLFGIFVATIVCGGGAYLLHANAGYLGLLGLAAICVPGMAFCLLLALWLDKRSAAQQEREKSGQP